MCGDRFGEKARAEARAEETAEICCREHSVADIEWLARTGAVPTARDRIIAFARTTYIY
ncbi:hypothetical protein [Rhodococcus oxybenzonivorans]|uniref:hypothetical protein n=1 Tax=Rhodococcus oxybenzonivorans TaxID=1990687 RepID=UPI0013A57736|nr:hypothetical protein [Rhodococcus oxybenzonivorans]